MVKITVFPAATPRLLRGDPFRLRQVITNLVNNAIKFTERGDVTLEIQIVAETETDARLRILVRDTGIGIPKQRQQVIFESFTQADGSTTRRFGGTSLGLTISRQLTELMGGAIGIESVEGQGSTFQVELTLAKQSSGAALPAPAAEIEGGRVLIVDDNPTNRRLFHDLLQAWGFGTVEAASGHEALAALARGGEPFSLILMDFQMPDMNGLTAGTAIRSDPRTEGLPMLMMSSQEIPRDQAVRIGFHSVLMKPVRQSVLYRALQEVLAPGTQAAAARVAPRESPRSRFDLRVVVAEDNAVNQKLAVRILERLGCSVRVAGNGVEALAAIEAGGCDVVLMDVQMPVMDGLQATIELRRREPASGSHLQVIAMTAHAMVGDRERCLTAGMDDYVTKPVRPPEIEAALLRALERSGRGLDRAA